MSRAHGSRRSGLHKLILAVLVSAGLLFAVTRFTNLTSAAQRFDDFLWAYLPLVLISILVYYLLKGLRWHLFLRTVDVCLPLPLSLLVYLAGQWFAFSPAGEFAKVYLLGRYGVDLGRASATVVMQVVIDFLSLAIVGTITLLWYPALAYLVLSFTALLIFGVVLVGQRGLWGKLTLWGPAARAYTSLGPSWQALFQGVRQLMTGQPLIVGLGLGLPTIVVGSLALLLVGWGYLVPLDLVQSTFVYSLSQLLGGLSMLPHGLGAVEGSSLVLFSQVGVWDTAEAAVVVALFRLASLVWGVLIGGLALLAMHLLPDFRSVPTPAATSAEGGADA